MLNEKSELFYLLHEFAITHSIPAHKPKPKVFLRSRLKSSEILRQFHAHKPKRKVFLLSKLKSSEILRQFHIKFNFFHVTKEILLKNVLFIELDRIIFLSTKLRDRNDFTSYYRYTSITKE